jgi:hypothetical protein
MEASVWREKENEKENERKMGARKRWKRRENERK